MIEHFQRGDLMMKAHKLICEKKNEGLIPCEQLTIHCRFFV